MTRFLLTLCIALGTLVSLPAKDKGRDPVDNPIPPSITVDSEVTGAWSTQSPGLDWTWDDPALKASVRWGALVPWSSNGDSALAITGWAKGRLGAKDPQGSRAFLALCRTKEEFLLGGRQVWRGDWGPAEVSADTGLDGGLLVQSTLDGDQDLQPPGVDAVAFWTQVVPLVAAQGDLLVKVPGFQASFGFRSEGGYVAEEAYGERWPAQVQVDLDSQVMLRILDLRKAEILAGLAGQFQWEDGPWGTRVQDQEELKFSLSRKGLDIDLVPISRSSGSWGIRSAVRCETGHHRITFGIEAPWSGSGLSLVLKTQEEY